MDSLDRNRWFPSGDGRQLGRVHANKTLSDDHAKVFHSGGVKRTFGDFEGQTMFPKMLKDTTSAFMMKGEGAIGVDAKVIHINF